MMVPVMIFVLLFNVGSFSSVLKYCKQNYKVLLVYLHSDEHQNTPSFCKNVMSKEGFKDFVDKNFVCFAANISSRNG